MSNSEHIPRTPFIGDDELLVVRELWRPRVQNLWQPYCWNDPTLLQELKERWLEPGFNDDDPAIEELKSNMFKVRSDDFDTTTASLWFEDHAYIIPPPIVKALEPHLAQNTANAEMFKQVTSKHIGSASAANFVRTFLAKNQSVSGSTWPNDYYKNHSSYSARTNFSVYPHLLDAVVGEKEPNIAILAPVLERAIPRFNTTDYYNYNRREGGLGWTIPSAVKGLWHCGFPVQEESLVVIGDNVVNAHWYEIPAEMLSLTFRYPELNGNIGRTMLKKMIAEVEGVFPVGSDYTELYDYHLMSNYSNIGWAGTVESEERYRSQARRF